MTDKVIDGIGYNRIYYSKKERDHCTRCAGFDSGSLCNKFTEPCGEDNFYWMEDRTYKEKQLMKAHEVRELVNALRKEAVTHCGCGSMREALSKVVHDFIKPY